MPFSAITSPGEKLGGYAGTCLLEPPPPFQSFMVDRGAACNSHCLMTTYAQTCDVQMDITRSTVRAARGYVRSGRNGKRTRVCHTFLLCSEVFLGVVTSVDRLPRNMNRASCMPHTQLKVRPLGMRAPHDETVLVSQRQECSSGRARVLSRKVRNPGGGGSLTFSQVGTNAVKR